MNARRNSSQKNAAAWCLAVALALLLMAFFNPRPVGAQQLEACVPSPEIKAALDQLPQYAKPDQGEVAFRADKGAKLDQLLRKYPDSLFVQRAIIEFNWFATDREKLIEKYQALEEQTPNDPRALYLYGLARYGFGTTEAIKVLESAIEKALKFPWPHLALADIYESHNFSDKEKAKSHLKAFLNLCPSSFEGYSRLARLDDKDYVRESAEKLGTILAARSDPEGVGAYSTLWSLEFKVHPPTEYDSLRKQVGEDLKRIRSLKLQEKREWYKALEEGYKLANNQKQSDWAKGERQRLFPAYWELAAAEQWRKDHEQPKATDPPEKRREYYSTLFKETGNWIKQRPNAVWMYWEQLNAIEHLDDVGGTEVEGSVDATYKAVERNADPSGMDSRMLFLMAEVLSKKKLQPDRQLELARKGLEKWEIESEVPKRDTWMDEKTKAERKFYQAADEAHGLALEADAYINLSQPDKAQLTLARLDERLENLKSLGGEKDEYKKTLASGQSAYWEQMARLAEAQSHKQDAMALYENGLLARLNSGDIPPAGDVDTLGNNAKKLWDQLGGTKEGWDAWYGRRASAEAAKANLTWKKASDPLPSFEIADLQGKTWKLSDLRGKVVLLNVWASW